MASLPPPLPRAAVASDHQRTLGHLRTPIRAARAVPRAVPNRAVPLVPTALDAAGTRAFAGAIQPHRLPFHCARR